MNGLLFLNSTVPGRVVRRLYRSELCKRRRKNDAEKIYDYAKTTIQINRGKNFVSEKKRRKGTAFIYTCF